MEIGRLPHSEDERGELWPCSRCGKSTVSLALEVRERESGVLGMTGDESLSHGDTSSSDFGHDAEIEMLGCLLGSLSGGIAALMDRLNTGGKNRELRRLLRQYPRSRFCRHCKYTQKLS